MPRLINNKIFGSRAISPKPLVLVAILLITVFIGFGLIFHRSERAKLSTRQLDPFTRIYYQARRPTIEETKKGNLALLKWRRSNDVDRYHFVDDILLSNALIGMTQEKVEAFLGSPISLVENGDVNLIYEVSLFSGTYDFLKITIKDNRVIEANLTVKTVGAPYFRRVNILPSWLGVRQDTRQDLFGKDSLDVSVRTLDKILLSCSTDMYSELHQ